MNLCTKKT